MTRISRFIRKSIVNKLIFFIVLILVAVGGILAVNIGAFMQVKKSLISMIDQDVEKVVQNTRFSQELSRLIALSNLSMDTFAIREDRFDEEKTRLMDALRKLGDTDGTETGVSKIRIQDYVEKLNQQLDRCSDRQDAPHRDKNQDDEKNQCIAQRT